MGAKKKKSVVQTGRPGSEAVVVEPEAQNHPSAAMKVNAHVSASDVKTKAGTFGLTTVEIAALVFEVFPLRCSVAAKDARGRSFLQNLVDRKLALPA